MGKIPEGSKDERGHSPPRPWREKRWLLLPSSLKVPFSFLCWGPENIYPIINNNSNNNNIPYY